jgi:hypothetical protein
MSFVSRTINFQLDLSRHLGLPVPDIIADIAAHLPPPNTNTVEMPSNFTILKDTRCHSDSWTWTKVTDLDACISLCALQAGCELFSYCPPPGQDGCTGASGEPTPFHCWGYQQGASCDSQPGWVSGRAVGSGNKSSVFVAFRDARIKDSDWFSLYPVWPTEALNLWSPDQLDMRAVAELSSRVYLSLADGRGTDVFAMAVRSGASEPFAFTPSALLKGLEAFMDNFFGPNLLCYAPGGGIENVGMIQAINEMLLFASPNTLGPSRAPPEPLAEYTLRLFPYWPANEPASFDMLLAKGGHLVSATWNNATGAVKICLPCAIITEHTRTSAYLLMLPGGLPGSRHGAVPENRGSKDAM